MKNNWQSVLLGSLILGGLLWTNWSCSPKQSEAPAVLEAQGMPVVVQEITPQTVELTQTATGVLKSRQEAWLTAEVAGTVVRKTLDVGSSVRIGDVIVQLDAEPYQLALAQAEAAFTSAQAAHQQAYRDYVRYKTLHESGDVSDYELETLRLGEMTASANLKMADAGLKLAQRNERLTRIASPVNGTVAELTVEIGQQLAPGMMLGRVVSTDQLEVEVGLSEQEIIKLQRGNKVYLRANVYPDQIFPAKVRNVGRAGIGMGLSFPVLIDVENSEGMLQPGMVAVVQIVYEHAENVVAIPRTALVLGAVVPTVFVLDSNRSFRRSLELGNGNDQMVVVKSGLSAGDRLIVSGQNVLSDSGKVKVL